MRSDWSGHLYGSLLVDSDSAVSADLLLDDSQQHVYVLTNSRVSLLSVSQSVLLSSFFLFFLNRGLLQSLKVQSDFSFFCPSLSCQRFPCLRVRDRQTVSHVSLSETRTVAGVSWKEGRSVHLLSVHGIV